MDYHNPYAYKDYLIYSHLVFDNRGWVEKDGVTICRVSSRVGAEKQIDILTEKSPIQV